MASFVNMYKHCDMYVKTGSAVALTMLVATIDAQWKGMGDAGSVRYEPALLPTCPTIRVLSTVTSQCSEIQHFNGAFFSCRVYRGHDLRPHFNHCTICAHNSGTLEIRDATTFTTRSLMTLKARDFLLNMSR